MKEGDDVKALDMVAVCETWVDYFGGDKKYVKTGLRSSSKAI